MSCVSPRQAYFSASVNPATGKRPIQFTLSGSFSGARLLLPCGKCAPCKLKHSQGWGMRCLHESKMHKENCFVTLTYDNEHLPDYGTLRPRHLQLFHKRLHNRLLDQRGVGIRYYACGEYGTLNKRPHYHSLIFGYDFKDKKLYSESKFGKLYSSEELDSLWYEFGRNGSPLGSCKVGAVTMESTCYVARYCVKKVDGPLRDNGHYLVYDSDGVVCERVPEFSHMSRRPGIGATYFERYGDEIAAHDSVIINGREVPSIRYYDDRIDEERLKVLKRNRRRKAVWAERLVDRRLVKGRILEALQEKRKRQL